MTSKTDFDTLQRFIFDSCDIRGEIVTLSDSFTSSVSHQNLSPAHSALIGEFFAATVMLGDSLKFDGILTVQARGDGIVPLVMAEANNKHEFRGILKRANDNSPETDGTYSLPDMLGNAVLSLTMDPTKGKRYQGIVPLEKDNLALCLNDYFSQSEQLPTHFIIYADDGRCGGLFLQALPRNKILDDDASRDAWDTAVQLASTLKAEELFSLDHKEVLYRLFHQLECNIFPEQKISYKCSCNFDRSGNAIASLGKAEAFELLEERGHIDINCEFCGKQYIFNLQALEKIFGGENSPPH